LHERISARGGFQRINLQNLEDADWAGFSLWDAAMLVAISWTAVAF
jgi:hypothetical protein